MYASLKGRELRNRAGSSLVASQTNRGVLTGSASVGSFAQLPLPSPAITQQLATATRSAPETVAASPADFSGAPHGSPAFLDFASELRIVEDGISQQLKRHKKIKKIAFFSIVIFFTFISLFNEQSWPASLLLPIILILPFLSAIDKSLGTKDLVRLKKQQKLAFLNAASIWHSLGNDLSERSETQVAHVNVSDFEETLLGALLEIHSISTAIFSRKAHPPAMIYANQVGDTLLAIAAIAGIDSFKTTMTTLFGKTVVNLCIEDYYFGIHERIAKFCRISQAHPIFQEFAQYIGKCFSHQISQLSALGRADFAKFIAASVMEYISSDELKLYNALQIIKRKVGLVFNNLFGSKPRISIAHEREIVFTNDLTHQKKLRQGLYAFCFYRLNNKKRTFLERQTDQNRNWYAEELLVSADIKTSRGVLYFRSEQGREIYGERKGDAFDIMLCDHRMLAVASNTTTLTNK